VIILARVNHERTLVVQPQKRHRDTESGLFPIHAAMCYADSSVRRESRDERTTIMPDNPGTETTIPSCVTIHVLTGSVTRLSVKS
jgi:hypothetical protein